MKQIDSLRCVLLFSFCGFLQCSSSSNSVGSTNQETHDAREASCSDSITNEEGIMVALGGVDHSNCGRKEDPCLTIKQGIERAKTHPKKTVFVAKGEYAENGLVLIGGITVRGGFFETGPALAPGAAAWKPACSSDASLVTITTINASIAVTANFKGEATLETLTIKSKTAAKKSESLYGLHASGAETVVNLHNVFIQVAKGGDGENGTPGVNGTAGATLCALSGSGANGAKGAHGENASVGQFVNGQYQPSHGTTGKEGTSGYNGSMTKGECASTYVCFEGCKKSNVGSCSHTAISPFCAEDGKPGCGGTRGTAGTRGQGGGSSIGIVAAQGAVVQIQGGEVKVSEGGRGGNGGKGGAEGSGGTGFTPASATVPFDCIYRCDSNFGSCSGDIVRYNLKAGTGGRGGNGGSGGQGGGGAGGFSAALVKTENGDITFTNTNLVVGAPGQGGQGGNGKAPDGIAKQVVP